MPNRFLAAILLAGVAACGSASPPGGSASASRTASGPPAAGAPLIAAVSGLPGAQLVNFYPLPSTATVRIVDGNGQLHASAQFVPPPAPLIGNAAPLLQSPVRTVAGAVFYADYTGTVHRLTPDGSTSVVATFPLSNSQQELSYAVSPDGAHLIAIVLTLPPVHNPPPQQLGDPLYQAGAHWSLKLETADVGSATKTTFERDLGAGYPNPTAIVGWDNAGPLATLSTGLGTQQGPASGRFFGQLIHIAPDGTHLERIGGTDCSAVDELANGTVLCGSDWQNFSVRSSAGVTLWRKSLPYNVLCIAAWLSPDGTAFACQDLIVTESEFASAARQPIGSNTHMVAVGWLDSNTVVEADQSSGQLSLYQARGLIKLRDLGVSGVVAGLL